MLKRLGQRGLSVVELMVGLAVGLFVVSAATLVVSSQLSSNRRLLLDTQLQQDLRVAADVIARDMRRAGAQLDNDARNTYWYAQASTATSLVPNTYQTINFVATPASVRYVYQRAAGGGGTTAGWRVNGTRLQSWVGAGWQDLTDDTVMSITSFTITPESGPVTVVPCPNDCPGGGQACWPTVQVRQYQIDIAAQAANDASIQRSIRSRVRVANDRIKNNTGSTTAICPP